MDWNWKRFFFGWGFMLFMSLLIQRYIPLVDGLPPLDLNLMQIALSSSFTMMLAACRAGKE